MSAAGKERTDAILKLAGQLLRSPDVRRYIMMSEPLRLFEYRSGSIFIAYLAHAEKLPDCNGYRATRRPHRLKIDVNGSRVFEVAWNDEGKRRKVCDEPGYWHERLREEIDRLAEDDDIRF